MFDADDTNKKTIDPDILDWAHKTLFDMLHGEKPKLETSRDSESWLFDQMTRMYDAGFLCEEPKCYVTLPGENLSDVMDPKFGTTLEQLKGITIREPLPKTLTSEAKSLRRKASKEGIKNFKVLGTDEAYRYYRDPLDQQNDADALVLIKGGLMELYQYVSFLKAQQDGVLSSEDTSFIVQSSDDFWKPMLSALGGFAEKQNHIVTNSRHSTCAKLAETLGDKVSNTPKSGDIPSIANAGAQVYVVTGTGKKVQDYRKVFNRRGIDMQVKWFHEAFAKPEGAEEFSYSYVGNLIEKYSNLYNHIRDNIGTDNFVAKLTEKGGDIKTAMALLDDSGFETKSGLTTGPEFQHAGYRLNNYRDFGPGPELKNIMNAMQNQKFDGKRGTRAMIRRMFAAADRIKDERIAAGDKDAEVSMDVRDRVSVMLFSFKDVVDSIKAGKDWRTALDETPIRYYQSITDASLIIEPRPDYAAVDTKYFMVPKNDPEQKTQAENPHFVALHSYTAQVMKAISRVTGIYEIENTDTSLSRSFTKASGEAWRLGTQHSLYKGRKSTGLTKPVRQSLTGIYKFMCGNGGMHDLSIARDHDVKRDDGSKFVMKTPLENFFNFTRKSEGFMLTPDSRTMVGDATFWERSFTFFSLIVGKQIKDKSVSAKPFFVMDCPTWQPLMKVFNHYAAGLIPEMPENIFSGVVKADDPALVEKMNEAFAEYEPDQVPENTFIEDGEKCPVDKYNVTIYCSASTTDGDMKDYARDFGFDLAAYGFGIKNGGGTGPDGLMFETSQGAKIFNEEFRPYLQSQKIANDNIPVAHVSSIQCQDTKEEEGLLTDVDYWAVYPTIYQRMHELQRTDAEVVLPGGAGTIQEIIGSVIMRKNGFYPVENRPLIIVNQGGNYDPFLRMIPKDDFKHFNIQVVETKEEAMEILRTARSAKEMAPLLPYTDEQYQTIKDAFVTKRAAHQPVLLKHTL